MNCRMAVYAGKLRRGGILVIQANERVHCVFPSFPCSRFLDLSSYDCEYDQSDKARHWNYTADRDERKTVIQREVAKIDQRSSIQTDSPHCEGDESEPRSDDRPRQ